MALSILKEIIESLSTIINTLRNFGRPERKKEFADAVSSIQLVSILTRSFIKDHGYISNTDLSKRWLDAMNKTVAAGLGNGLPNYLIDKAKFWGEPQLWLNNPESMKLVPKLNDLEQKCEMILMELKLG